MATKEKLRHMSIPSDSYWKMRDLKNQFKLGSWRQLIDKIYNKLKTEDKTETSSKSK